MNLSTRTYTLILFGAILWCAAIVLAPLVASSGSPSAEYLYRFFQPICHQRGERSFFLFEHKLGVCTRCTSVYCAFLAGVLVYPFVRGLRNLCVPPRSVLLLALAPITVEVATEWVGWYSSSPFTRSLTGALLGFVLAFTILPVALEAVQQIADRRAADCSSIINKSSKQ
ncbi:MAG: hypothetical protein C4326_04925 [Ignavibacteria bacterium]